MITSLCSEFLMKVFLISFQQLKAKESVRKNSVGSTSKRHKSRENSKDEDFRSNHGQIISVPSTDNESESERSSVLSDVSSRRLKQDLEVALRGGTTDSNGKISEAGLRPRMSLLTRTSSARDSDSDSGKQSAQRTDKMRSQTVREKGAPPKPGRQPPPKPPRAQVLASNDTNAASDSESSERIETAAPKAASSDNEKIGDPMHSFEKDNEGETFLRRIPTPDYSLDEPAYEEDSADGAMQKLPSRVRSSFLSVHVCSENFHAKSPFSF